MSSLLSLMWKVTLLLLIALALDAALRRRRVLECAAMWNASLLAMLLLPITTLFLPSFTLPVLPRALVSAVALRSLEDLNGLARDDVPSHAATPSDLDGVSNRGDGLAGMSAPAGTRLESTPGPLRASSPGLISGPSLGRMTLALYLLGVSVCQLWLLISLIAVSRLRIASEPPQDSDWTRRVTHWRHELQIDFPVEVRVSPQVDGPLVLGLFRPLVLISPDFAANLEPEHRDAVIIHELAHVARRDCAWELLARLLGAMLWIHPLIWLARRRIDFIRERACDDFSASVLGSAEAYADTLLTIAGRLSQRRAFRFGTAVVRTPRIAARLDTLLTGSGCARCLLPSGGRRILLASALLFAGVVGTFRSVVAEPAPEKPVTTQASAPNAPKPAAASEPAAPADAPTHPLSVTGRALDAEGRPIADAKIFIVSTNGIDKPLGTANTDREGRYAFQAVPLPIRVPRDKDHYTAAYFQVFGWASGFGVSWRGMKAIYLDQQFPPAPDSRKTGYLPNEQIELDLAFETREIVGGRFVDERGQPIAGVKVRLAHCDYLETEGKESDENFREFWALHQAADLIPAALIATSNAEGYFLLNSVAPERICWLLVTHPDYARKAVYVATSSRGITEHDEHPVERLPLYMTLNSTRQVLVQVRYQDTDKIAAGVRVSMSQMRASGDSAHGKSDEQGNVLLRLPPGKYRLVGDPPNGEPYVRSEQQIAVEDQPAEQQAVLKLQAGTTLILKAIDADTGAGIPGVSFWYEMQEPKGGRTSVQSNTHYIDNPRTDAKGELHAVVYPGKRRYGIGFSPLPEGYRAIEPADDSPGRELTLDAGTTTTAVFQVRRETTK